jgi:hypothetical protein
MLYDTSDLTTRPVRSTLETLHEGMQTILLILVFGLLWLGFVGLAYQTLRDGGWVDGILGRLWAQHPTTIMIVVFATCAAAARLKLKATPAQMFGKRGDYLLYAGIAAGLYFAGKLAWTGSL